MLLVGKVKGKPDSQHPALRLDAPYGWFKLVHLLLRSSLTSLFIIFLGDQH